MRTLYNMAAATLIAPDGTEYAGTGTAEDTTRDPRGLTSWVGAFAPAERYPDMANKLLRNEVKIRFGDGAVGRLLVTNIKDESPSIWPAGIIVYFTGNGPLPAIPGNDES